MSIIVDPKPDALILDRVQPEDYVFGSGKIAGDQLVKDGQWDEYLNEPEWQYQNGLETFSCVPFGTHEDLETLLRRQYGIRANFSDRYGAYIGGTTQRGTSPQTFIENLRRYGGTVPEGSLAFHKDIDTWEEWISGATFEHRLAGVRWLKEWEVFHEWVWEEGESVENKQARLMDALKFSPVCVSVQAWSEDNGYYVKTGPDNHWSMIIGFKKGRYWKVRDTYPDSFGSFEKKLEWNYFFGMAKRYAIKRRENLDPEFVIRAIRGAAGIY